MSRKYEVFHASGRHELALYDPRVRSRGDA